MRPVQNCQNSFSELISASNTLEVLVKSTCDAIKFVAIPLVPRQAPMCRPSARQPLPRLKHQLPALVDDLALPCIGVVGSFHPDQDLSFLCVVGEQGRLSLAFRRKPWLACIWCPKLNGLQTTCVSPHTASKSRLLRGLPPSLPLARAATALAFVIA